MHRAVHPAPPWAIVMFRLSSGFRCAPDPGACGQAGALGTALLHRERGDSQQPSSPGLPLPRQSPSLLLQVIWVASHGVNEPWRNRHLPRRQPIVAGFHMLFHSKKLPEVSILGSPFLSSSCK